MNSHHFARHDFADPVRYCLLACLLLTAGPAWAQDEPEVVVELSHERIYQGESVQYQVILNNVQHPQPPKLEGFEDFEIRPEGETSLDSRQIFNINGRVTETVRYGRAYKYVLTPKRSGKLQIPGPLAEVGGRELRGPSRTLEVIAPAEQELALIAIKASRPRVYPLQPFTIQLTVALKGLPEPLADRNPLTVVRRLPALLTIPWADDEALPKGLDPQRPWQEWLGALRSQSGRGFTVNGIAAESVFSLFENSALAFLPAPRRVKRKTAAGGQTDYWEFEFARTFTPRELGTLTFGPVTLKGVFVSDVSSEGRGKFEDVYAVAPAVSVTVQDVPEAGRPDSYIQAIGKFTVESSLSPLHAKVGDPLTLNVTLQGQGTLEAARAPDLNRQSEVTERFRVYEAREETGDGTRRFAFTLRPLQAGPTTFPAIPISYFDVDRERYVTLRTKPISIQVEQAEQVRGDEIAMAAPARNAGQSVEVREDGILANVTDLGAVRDQSAHPGRWLSYAAALALAYAGLLLISRPLSRYLADEALQRRRAAPNRARQRLREADAELAAGRVREGAEHLGSALIGLVADVSGRPEPGMTSREVDAELAALGVPEDLRREIAALLETCDGARYGASQGSLQGLVESAQRLREELVRALKSDRRW